MFIWFLNWLTYQSQVQFAWALMVAMDVFCHIRIKPLLVKLCLQGEILAKCTLCTISITIQFVCRIVLSIWQYNTIQCQCLHWELNRIAPLIAELNHHKKSSMCNPLVYIAVTFEPNMLFFILSDVG